MKQILTFSLLTLFFTFKLTAQHFDAYNFDNYVDVNDNDLKNNFTNISNFYQTATTGIPGGCVNITNTLSNASAKSKISFVFKLGDTLKFSCQVYFRGDTISTDTLSPAFGFRMHPYSIPASAFDFSKYLEYFIDKTPITPHDAIGTACHDGSRHWNVTQPVFLPESWYLLEFQSYKNAAMSNINTTGTISKLSADGQTNLGVMRTFTNDIISDPDMYNAELYTFVLKGRYYEGVKQIDNINITSSSFPTSIQNYYAEKAVPSPVNTLVDDNLYINKYSYPNVHLSVFDLFGQKVHSEKPQANYVNLQNLAAGQYICSLESENSRWKYRILKK